MLPEDYQAKGIVKSYVNFEYLFEYTRAHVFKRHTDTEIET